MSEEKQNDDNSLSSDGSVHPVAPEMEETPLCKDVCRIPKARGPSSKADKAKLCRDLVKAVFSGLQKTSAKDKIQLIRGQLSSTSKTGDIGNQISRHWTVECMASKLASLHCWCKKHKEENQNSSAALGTRSSNKPRPAELTKLLSGAERRFDSVLVKDREKQEAQRARQEAAAQKKARAQGSRAGSLPQDFMEFDVSKALTEPCPRCGHHCTMTAETAEEIEKANQEICDNHQKRVNEWLALPATVRAATKKPKQGKTKQQTIACFCHKLHCFDMPDGGRCHKCRPLVAQGKPRPVVNGKCACELCHCSCRLVLGRSGRCAIALENDPFKIKEEELQPSVGGLLNFVTDSVASRAHEQHQKNPCGDPRASARSAHSQTLMDISNSPVIGSVACRSKLQKALGPLPQTSSKGETMEQLRNKKRNRKRAPMDDSRFTRNRLVAGSFAAPTVVGTGASNDPVLLEDSVASKSSFDADTPHRPRALARPTPGGTPECDKKLPAEETPEFHKEVRREAVRRNIEFDDSPDTCRALDCVSDRLHAANASTSAVGLQRHLNDVQVVLPEKEKACAALCKHVKRRKFEA